MEGRRERMLTSKGEELFEEKRAKLLKEVKTAEGILKDLMLKKENLNTTNASNVRLCIENLKSARNKYTAVINEFSQFLNKTNTKESIEECETVNVNARSLELNVLRTCEQLATFICSSRTSSNKTNASEKRARAEAARVRLEYAKREAEMKKAVAAIDADLLVLREEKEAMAADAEASYLEERERDIYIDLPFQDPEERSREYIKELSLGDISNPKLESEISEGNCDMHQNVIEPVASVNYSMPINSDRMQQTIDNVRVVEPDHLVQNHPPLYQIPPRSAHVMSADTDILTSFLLRKEMMPKRLQKFNEKPQSFNVWKTTFKIVMNELKATPEEEVDFLVNNLGTESQMWAESLRAANAADAQHGLDLIWERLEHCYGSPEKIEASLKARIENFPILTNRDTRKLYELSDMLLEIQSIKSEIKYSSQFAMFDTSAGVNQIVGKLPYSMQQRWISHASKYKKDKRVIFPPFSVLVDFVKDISKTYNDPAFQISSVSSNDHPKNSQRSFMVNNARAINFKSNRAQVVNRKTAINDSRSETTGESFGNSEDKRCPIHHSGHSLLECNTFRQKTMDSRQAFLKEKGICYRCLLSKEHQARHCPLSVSCEKCGKKGHRTLMHRESIPVPQTERTDLVNVASKCTTLCGQDFNGRSCGKVVLVNVSNSKQSDKTELVYAILDDQSNASLIAPELCDKLNVQGTMIEYTLSSCSGSVVMAGRRASGLIVSSVDGSTTFELPTLVECDAIPQNSSEIPTPEVAMNFPHLKRLASLIPPLEENCQIQLLIGRDIPAVHHVLEQVLGPREAPFAVQLPLGWVIIGEVCLGKVHPPDSVNTYFTNISNGGRSSIFRPCESYLSVKEPGSNCLFHKSHDDNKVGLSVDDRDFLKIMDEKFTKDDSGLWIAPLPFRSLKPTIPDNRDQAFKRAFLLKKNLEKNPEKCRHLVQFMEKIFKSGAAEKAPENDLEKNEKWYLPLFGVYHPKKKDQIRGVFDSSVSYKGCCLNDLLLSGPNLTNSLLGVLLRFRKDKCAFSADIEQMFYRFLVDTKHRDYLRFFWFENNDPERPLTIYRMRVHVFGNRPSPAVATYGLRKTVENANSDVRQFVERDFYVDDALASRATWEEAVHLLKNTKQTLLDNGKIRLHKIASNNIEVMNKFPPEELSTTLKNLDLDESLPIQHSLGLSWDLNQDVFRFMAPTVERPFTRRGILSTINSVFDPVGFVAPFTISGKMLLRNACPDGTSWDDPLPTTYAKEWNMWRTNLEQLNGYKVPRMYISESLSLVNDYKVYIYSDASEGAVAAAGYVVIEEPDNSMTGFIMGKAKLAPRCGHSIPRLELCAAVLAVEVGASISEQLDISPSTFRFFTDSKVVLGYIHNRSRRFHTYVSNRVAQIHVFSSPDQWSHVQTEFNPADAATRSISDHIGLQTELQKWLTGPTYLFQENSTVTASSCYPLLLPDEDVNVRPEVIVKTTNIVDNLSSIIDSVGRFSTWSRFVRAISILIHVAKTYAGLTKCTGWHVCKESSAPDLQRNAERLILSMLQKKHFSDEILALQGKGPLLKKSSIISLSPFMDSDGILRVGGRLKRLANDIGIASVHPLIVPKGHIAKLLVRHYHQQTSHQGRHFTEGAVRSNGLWIVGLKKLVSSVIHNCVMCRKLRGPLLQQKMADLPSDRLVPSPPFVTVGVDVFGPWEIVTRKTRGGVANGKRWAVLFSCLTTRATHIEVIEDMSASCFINALRRFVAIRGPVKVLRSDRGTNFIGAADELGVHVINVEDPTFQVQLNKQGICWYFNAPHASHMGGVWERAIGVVRRILDGMLLNNPVKQLTHEVICTLMAEVSAIMNSRPIVAVDSDSSDPMILSPNILLTQKQGEVPMNPCNFGIKDCYRAQWKHVKVLSDIFWKKWQSDYLNQLQIRRKWEQEVPNLKKGDVVLMRERTCRNQWPVAVIEDVFPSDDTLVRKVAVKFVKEGRPVTYTRPISELVLLLNN